MEVVLEIENFLPWQVPLLIRMTIIIRGPRITIALANVFTQFSLAVFYQSSVDEPGWLTLADAVVANIVLWWKQNQASFKAMVECLRPQSLHTIADPACGTGGFFPAAYDWMTDHLEPDKEQKEVLKYHRFAGNEIVAGTRRLAFMNS